jgi:hypothetical protein
MRTLKLLLVALGVCCLIASASPADEGKNESGKGKKRSPSGQQQQGGGQGSYFHEHGYTKLDIPKGHYPAPGECRIWYPDRPAGQQPPPGKCQELRSQVPPGAWLITHPPDDPKHVHINVYDERRPNTLQVVGEFDIDSGAFVRVVLGK